MKRYKRIYIILIAVFILLILFGRRPADTLVLSVDSPDGQHTLSIYTNTGGATVANSVTATISAGNLRWAVYFAYREYRTSGRWVDNRTVEVNGITIDIYREYYETRND